MILARAIPPQKYKAISKLRSLSKRTSFTMNGMKQPKRIEPSIRISVLFAPSWFHLWIQDKREFKIHCLSYQSCSHYEILHFQSHEFKYSHLFLTKKKSMMKYIGFFFYFICRFLKQFYGIFTMFIINMVNTPFLSSNDSVSDHVSLKSFTLLFTNKMGLVFCTWLLWDETTQIKSEVTVSFKVQTLFSSFMWGPCIFLSEMVFWRKNHTSLSGPVQSVQACVSERVAQLRTWEAQRPD